MPFRPGRSALPDRPHDLTGRTYLITGAASGIGAEIARGLAAPGACFAIHTRSNRDGAEETIAALRAAGAKAALFLTDLAEADAGRHLVDSVQARFGRLDVLVSNAGFADRRGFDELDTAGFEKSASVIQRAFFEMASAALPALCAAPAGRVVAIGSFVAKRFQPHAGKFAASAAAKAGLEALVKALAMRLAPHGATANCVIPGYIRKQAGAHSALTPEAWQKLAAEIPLQRLGTPQDVAALVGFLCSPAAGYITAQSIMVDGGLTA